MRCGLELSKVWLWEGFYCRYEGEYCQRHLEETEVGRQNNILNMASRLNHNRKERGKREKRREEDKRRPREYMAKMEGLYKNEKLKFRVGVG